MSDLVLGGTGRVGRMVVEGLVAQGREVRVLTRSRERARDLPAAVGTIVGDLLDPRGFPAAFAGAERVFLVNGASQTELFEGLAAVNEARRAGAGHLVYLSVLGAESAPGVPHFASKMAIEAAIRGSGIPHTILRAGDFYQNDDAAREAIIGYGVYPHPLGDIGVARVDARDVADAAVNAMLQGGPRGTCALVGESLTGAETARSYADALGREVRYAGNDLDAWERLMLRMLPAWQVYGLRLMYEVFQQRGLRAASEHAEQTRSLLGRAPRTLSEYAGLSASAWTAEMPLPLP